jgi:hypothetical protein
MAKERRERAFLRRWRHPDPSQKAVSEVAKIGGELQYIVANLVVFAGVHLVFKVMETALPFGRDF